MSKYTGSGITVTINGTSVGQLVNFDPPGEEFDRIDFTGLSDNYPDTQLAGIPNATETELVYDFDRSVADQGTLEGLIGSNTSVDLVITYPWATNNTYTQSIKVYGQKGGTVEKKGRLQNTLMVVTTSDYVWSTV